MAQRQTRITPATRTISDQNMQYGRPWRGEDVRGWFGCEKLDGCRGYCDGERMLVYWMQ